MKLVEGVCHGCRKHDSDHEVHLFSAEINTLPDEMPIGLPEPTQVEEILISRVHVFIEVPAGDWSVGNNIDTRVVWSTFCAVSVECTISCCSSLQN